MKNYEIDFLKVTSTLSLNKIDYWLCHGTLLGIVRSGEIIPWDPDLDFAIDKNRVSHDQVINIMSAAGFKLVSDGWLFARRSDYLIFQGCGEKSIDINFYVNENQDMSITVWYKLKTSKINNVAIIISSFVTKILRVLFYFNQRNIKRYEHRIDRFIGKFLAYNEIGYRTPSKYLKNFKQTNFLGKLVCIPERSEEILTYLYGSDWKIEKPEYQWQSDSSAAFEQ